MRFGAAFTVLAYDHEPDAGSVGLQTAHAPGEALDRVLKTLMV